MSVNTVPIKSPSPTRYRRRYYRRRKEIEILHRKVPNHSRLIKSLSRCRLLINHRRKAIGAVISYVILNTFYRPAIELITLSGNEIYFLFKHNSGREVLPSRQTVGGCSLCKRTMPVFWNRPLCLRARLLEYIRFSGIIRERLVNCTHGDGGRFCEDTSK